MAVINDVGGTSLNSFSINGGVTFYQGDNLPNVKMGKEGDYYFKSDGYLYVKRNGVWINLTSSAMPDARTIKNKVIYSNGENYAPSGISYNADTKGTYMDGALVIGEHPSANGGDSKIVPTIGWVNDPKKSLNVVHRTGDETINGNKTFYQPLRINCKDSNDKGLFTTTLALESYDVKKNQVPPTLTNRTDQTRYWTVCAVDKTLYNQGATLENIDTPKINYNKFGQFEVAYYTNKKVETKMEAFDPNANDSRAVIAIGWDENNNKYSRINVDPADKSNDQSIATTKWANKNCVMTYGNQNVAGNKTFTDSIVAKHDDGNNFGYRIQTKLVKRGTKPSDTIELQFVAQGNDGLSVNQRLGGMYVYYNKNGNIYTDLIAYKPEIYNSTNNPNKNAYIRIVYPLSGDPYTSAPHPAENSNNTNIATTYWVNKNINTKIANNKAIVRNDIQIFNETIRDYWGATNQCFRAYIEFNNGFKIQWGLTTAHGQHARVDLLTPFKNKNYSVTLSRYCEEWAEGVMMQSTDHNEGFFYVTLNDPGCHWMAVGY